jgi:hypothetical protein
VGTGASEGVGVEEGVGAGEGAGDGVAAVEGDGGGFASEGGAVDDAWAGEGECVTFGGELAVRMRGGAGERMGAGAAVIEREENWDDVVVGGSIVDDRSFLGGGAILFVIASIHPLKSPKKACIS